jgi:hypothetical protein
MEPYVAQYKTIEQRRKSLYDLLVRFENAYNKRPDHGYLDDYIQDLVQQIEVCDMKLQLIQDELDELLAWETFQRESEALGLRTMSRKSQPDNPVANRVHALAQSTVRRVK